MIYEADSTFLLLTVSDMLSFTIKVLLVNFPETSKEVEVDQFTIFYETNSANKLSSLHIYFPRNAKSYIEIFLSLKCSASKPTCCIVDLKFLIYLEVT